MESTRSETSPHRQRKLQKHKKDNDRLSKGRRSEELARAHLESQGLTTLLTNFRCRLGEIDLIMKEQNTIVLVEVRYRKNDRFGGAAASVTNAKRNKLLRTAMVFMQQFDSSLKHAYRFDVVAIAGNIEEQPLIEWISPAF